MTRVPIIPGPSVQAERERPDSANSGQWQDFSASTALVRYTRSDSALLLSLTDVPGPKVAILGGSFDPIHPGHVQAARRALSHHQLNSVIFLPGSGNPEKPGHHFTEEERFAMTHEAVREIPGLYICPLHMAAFKDNPSPYLPVRAIKAALPSDTELYFIMGTDYIPKLGRSRPLQQLVEICRPIFVEREGFNLNDAYALLHPDQLGHSRHAQKLVAQILDDLVPLGPGSTHSSTRVREFLRRGDHPPEHMVPKAVRSVLRKTIGATTL